MKKILIPFLAVLLFSCNPKPRGTVPPRVVQDTLSSLPIIDTTIFEDGKAPVGEGEKAKGEKQKKEKVACAFNLTKFNNRKRPKEEAPGGVRGKPPKPPKPGTEDTQAPTLNGNPQVSVIMTNRMNIDWPAASDNKGVTGYDLFRDGQKINSSNITSTGWVDIGLTPATSYTYYYRAKDAAGNLSQNSGSVVGTTLSGNTDPPPPGSNNVIYLNFFGKNVTGTAWNSSGDILTDSSGLAQVEIDYVVTQVREHYKDYNVNVTTNKSEFDAAAFGHKVEIIITESYQWFGQAGGVAYINSFFWTDGTPGFVFSLLLNYNSHWIAEAAAHEAGHTLGLRHQSDCENGVVINPYSNGKTMGVSYYSPLGIWFTGTSSLSCQIQNDTEKLTAAIGLRQFAYIRFRKQNKL